MRTRVLVLFVAGMASALWGAPPPEADPNKDEVAGQAILQQYLNRTPQNQAWLRGVQMEVEMNGSLPSLNKSGSLRAFRSISRLGQITYRVLTMQGDKTVQKDLIARYMEAEMKSTDAGSIAINEQNYKFKYRGLYENIPGWQLHLFELSPKAKRVGLFKGWLWIHAKTGLPVREEGELVKNPSIFLKKVAFIRDYQIENGVAVPWKMESTIDTRVVGRAQLNIEFSNYIKQNAAQVSARSTSN